MSSPECYVYVSTRSCEDPVRTIVLCVPDASVRSVEDVQAFASASGWIDEAEFDGAVLLAPVVAGGWASAQGEPARDCFFAQRRMLQAPSHVSLPGRDGGLWAWEPLICLVGYEEGAAQVGATLVAHPSFAASAVLVDGAPQDLSRGEEPSDHWLVPKPSEAYHALNREVPVAAWLMGSATEDAAFVAYLEQAGGPSWRIRRSPELSGTAPALARLAMREFMTRVLRWKNAPDGTLAWHVNRQDFYLGERFEHASVEVGGLCYHYATHLPQGMTGEDVRGLPLVLSIHGRGEPAWLYAEKNGWEDLADETQAFVVVTPSSPRNIWMTGRDDDVLERIIAQVVATYGCDRSRVYLTGFSNGAAYTCQQATERPWLFAAASPWNCPPDEAIISSGLGKYIYAPDAADKGYQMPFWVCAGACDDKGVPDRSCDLPIVRALARRDDLTEQVWDGENHYVDAQGYAQGDRLTTQVLVDGAGVPRAGITQVRDMPHGAIADEARAAWEFMKRFRRPEGARMVEEVNA